MWVQGTFSQSLRLPLDQISGALKRYDISYSTPLSSLATLYLSECPSAQFSSRVLFLILNPYYLIQLLHCLSRNSDITVLKQHASVCTKKTPVLLLFSHYSFHHKCINGFTVTELNTNAIGILCKSIWMCFLLQISMVLILKEKKPL